MIQQNASAAEEMASTSEGLAGQAEQLKATIGFFNIEDSGRKAMTRAKRPTTTAKAAPPVAHITRSVAAEPQQPQIEAGQGGSAMDMADDEAGGGDDPFEKY